MDAASSALPGRGATCLLQLCLVLERVTASERPSARARLESELGCELAHLLLGALVTGRGRPPALVLL